jgi:hypothetical protein
MSDEAGNDADDGLTECQVCGTPIVTVVVRGPSPAERYARPCGHRLPANFDFEGDIAAPIEDASAYLKVCSIL